MGLKLLKIQEIKTGVHGDAVEYSRIGPSYETPGPRGQLQPVSGPRDRDSARLSERYEFSEPSYLGTGGGGSDGQAIVWIMKFHSKVDSMKSTHIFNIETKVL